jgi:DNA-directed RNA polymerase specialized sigma24 family protein
MADAEFSEAHYWDYVSVCEQAEGNETIKDLLKEAYDFASPFLNNLLSYEGDMVYMNLVSDVPQTVIADVFGLSQLGVSKRVRGGISKLKSVMQVPETNRVMVKEHLSFMLPSDFSPSFILYYHYKTFSLVADLLQVSSSNIRNWVNVSLQILKEISEVKNQKEFVSVMIRNMSYDYEKDYSKFEAMKSADFSYYQYQAEKYYTYIEGIIEQSNYGDYIFKAEGEPRGDIRVTWNWSPDE